MPSRCKMALSLSILSLLSSVVTVAAQQSTSIPSWCGKPYEPGYPQYDSAGNLSQPALSSSQLLYVQVAPRYSIYLASESEGSFIVDAALSNIHGNPYYNVTSTGGSSTTAPFDYLYFTIHLESKDAPIVQSNVSVNSTSNAFNFSFAGLKPKTTPYNVVLYGASVDGNQSYTATTQLFYLPSITTGSAVKVDNLYGGLLIANENSRFAFEPVFSFGFYTQYSDFIEASYSNIESYAANGYNSVHPEPTYSDNVTAVFEQVGKAGLYITYDMRGTYQNVTSVTQQVNTVKNLPTLLTWYTADEPDGNQDPLDAPLKAFKLIQELDPYHPVSLVLNCYNYYFQDYAQGAQILMADPYPIGINSTYSKWGTVCNATYGDCGCDDCNGQLSDVSTRLDILNKYQDWLGWWRKPTWAVLQSFYGEGYWDRNPTVAETYAMNSLSVNHGAKGITLWFYPTETELAQANGIQAKVLQAQPVLGFLTGANPVPIKISGHPLLDVAYWSVGDQILIGVANLGYSNTAKAVTIPLPFAPSGAPSQVWGNSSWALGSGGLVASNLLALATSLVIIDVSH